MNSNSIFRVAVAFAAGLFVIAFAYFTLIRPFWEASRGGAVVMRSYPISAEYAGEVREALQSSLIVGGEGKADLGRVTLAPNGQLIVTAPESIQRGVNQLLEQIMANAPSKTPTIKLETWLVTTSEQTVSSSPSLKEVEAALAAISEAQGSKNFELLEKLTIHIHSGMRGSMNGLSAMVSASPTVRRGANDQQVVSVMLSLQTLAERGSVNTVVELAPGELVVFGQANYGAASKARAETIFYIIRATL